MPVEALMAPAHLPIIHEVFTNRTAIRAAVASGRYAQNGSTLLRHRKILLFAG